MTAPSMRTLPGLLIRNEIKYPDVLAVRAPATGVELTWSELGQRARRVAGTLLAAGVVPGDRVALLHGNDTGFVEAFFGAALAGGVVVPVNPRLTAPEAAYILGHAQARAAVVGAGFTGIATEAAAGLSTRLVFPEDVLAAGGADPVARAGAAVTPGMDAEILYTSGTTGRPKGVVLTHEAVVETAAMAAYQFGFRVGEHVLVLMPLTHSAPLNLFLVGAAYTGASVVVDTFNPREPAALLQVVAAERAEYLFGAPVAYLLGLRADPSRYDLSSMRLWVYGGAPMAPEQVQAVRGAYGGAWMGVYGLTETGPNGMALEPGQADGHAGSLGRDATVDTVIRLVDPSGAEVSDGEPGEIVMLTTSAMRCYLDDPESTAETLRDGWVWTGDVARRDEDGYLWMVDRKKDVVLSGGYNVYPREVEEVLLAHPAVADVAVVGTPHAEWGETVTAVVVLAEGASLTLEELRQFTAGRLASQKQPRRLEIVEAIPRNATGKILKHVVRSSLAGTG